MRLLVFLPAYNEAPTIEAVISKIPKAIERITTIDALVINDGSTDDTATRAQAAGATVLTHTDNRGLGLSFQEAVRYALSHRYDMFVNIDADGQFNPEDIPRLIEPIIHGRAAMVTASRFKDARLVPQMPAIKRWGNRRVAHLVSMITGHQYYDVSCGFRAFSREALLRLNLFSRYTYTHETILNLAFNGLRIEEVPTQVRGEREHGESKVASNLWKFAYHIMNTVFRTMLDYRPLRFFGWIGATLFGLGLLLDAFIGIRLLVVGAVTPFKTIGFVGLALNIFGLLLLVVGLLADMINRIRRTQERALYLQKCTYYLHDDVDKPIR